MVVKTIAQLNAYLIPPVGLLLNFLFIWLVLKKTPKEMRVHSRILLQTSLYDIFYLTSLIIGVPFVLLAEGVHILLYYGYFANLLHQLFGPSGLYYYTIPVYFFFYFDLYAVCIQFLYRYLVLNRDIKVTVFQYLLMLSVAIGAALLVMIQYSIFVPTTFKTIAEYNSTANFDFLSDWSPLVFIAYGQSSVQGLFDKTVLLFLFVSYAIILFCGWKMVRFVNAHTGFNPSLKALNRQLTLNLMLLALIPLFLSFIDFAVMGTQSLPADDIAGRQALEFQFYFFLPSFWMPLMNPVVSILTNKPYRTAVFAFFKKSSVQPVIVNVAAAIVK